jgi:hypothetical protein
MRYQISLNSPSGAPSATPARSSLVGTTPRGATAAAPAKRPQPASDRKHRRLRLAGVAALAVTLGVTGILALRVHVPTPEPADTGTVLAEATADELIARESIELDELATALKDLRHLAQPADGTAAFAAATRDPELLRRLACDRAREASTLDLAFAALPVASAADAAWQMDGAKCLVELIASRAGERPELALPLLVERVLVDDSDAILDGLTRIDAPQLPMALAAEIASGAATESRQAALRAAIALGAAAKWPEQVEAWLNDGDRDVRVAVHDALGRQGDEASQKLAARTRFDDIQP